MSGKATLYDAIDSHIQRFANNLYTALPAIVESYNAEKQTVTVKPTLNVVTNKDQELPWASIPDVPVMFPSAGGGIISFPIQKGDNVLLVFSKNSLDRWKAGKGQSVKVESRRQHSASDAIAIVGLTTPKSNLSPNPTDVEIKFKDTKVTLKEDGTYSVTSSRVAFNNDRYELVALLSELIESISAITVNTTYGPSPVNNKIDFELIKSKLDTFLEG